MSVPVKSSCENFYQWLKLTDILSRTVTKFSKLSQNVVQILDTLHFEPPVRSLGATYTIHLRLTGKLVIMNFLFVLTELFSLGVTAEALRANIDGKSAFPEGVSQFRPNFHVVGDVP